jgi:hypothetical protein
MKMNRQLKYYEKNKNFINLKRRLKYKLNQGKLSIEEYNLQIDTFINKENFKYIGINP